MSQDDRSAISNLPIAGLLTLVLFASGLAVQHIPIESDRPLNQSKQLKPSTDGQIVEARLWQDPFDAIRRHVEECARQDDDNPSAASCPPAKFRQAVHEATWFKGYLEKESFHDTLILPVFVFGGPYAEDTEDRRRYRYAVLSALRASGYEPANSRAVGYVQLKQGDDGEASPDRDEQKCKTSCEEEVGMPLDRLVVPFERWSRDEPDNKSDTDGSANARPLGAWKHVMIIWLKEEWFSNEAQRRLDWMFNQLLPKQLERDQIKLIGPSSHKTVKTLFPTSEAPACLPPRVPGDFRQSCRNPRQAATGSDLADAGSASCKELDRARIFGDCRQFISPTLSESNQLLAGARMSPNDDAVVGTLIDELVNRGLQLPTRKDTAADCDSHVALVVESDTQYGRSLEREVKKQLSSCNPDGAKDDRHLHIYRYFRGLDGKAAYGAEGSSKPAAQGGDKAKDQTPAPQERAQGEGQFDYLLRVANAVRERNDKLATESRYHDGFEVKPHGIRAVLVFGSDVHDKLAVLHALREKMPQAQFATNDLDAGLLQSNRLSWTRNLIVASGYGLKVGASLQQGAAPFRDSYQTARFLATLLAVKSPMGEHQEIVQKIHKHRQQVKLYEIGNGVAEEMAPRDGKGKQKSPAFVPLWWAGTAILMLVGFLATLSWCVRNTVVQHRWTILVATLLVLAYVGAAIQISSQAGEESLSLTKGISIWPSEFIRLGVFLLAIYWLRQAFCKLCDGDLALGKRFFKRTGEATDESDKEGSCGLTICEFFKGVRGKLKNKLKTAFPEIQKKPKDSSQTQEPVDIGKLWNDYQRWTSPAATAIRVALGLFFFFFLSVLILPIDPPVAPVRGELSRLMDQLTVGVAVLATCTLLIYVVDRVAITSLFLQRLYGNRGHPAGSLWEKFTGMETCCGQTVSDADTRPQAVAVRSYVDLRLCGQLTQSVGGIVIYPFVLSLLMIFARSRYFDNWVMAAGLFVVIGFGLVLVTVSAFALRRAAEEIRRYTVERLQEAEIVMKGTPPKTTGAQDIHGEVPPPLAEITTDQLKMMREAATSLREGAFAPITEQPIVRALMLPFGGAGLVSLVDWAVFL